MDLTSRPRVLHCGTESKPWPGSGEMDAAKESLAAHRGACRAEASPWIARCWLRVGTQMADTSSMVRTIRQIACILVLTLLSSLPFCAGQGSKKSDTLRFFSGESGLIRYARFRGQPAPSKELHALLNRQARWDEAGLGGSNGTGSSLRFVKIDEAATPGKGSAARYRVFAEGAPQDKVFVLQTWVVSGLPTTDPRDLYVNSQGLVMTRRPKPEEEASLKAADELEVSSSPEKGEPIRYSLARRDGESSIYGTLIWDPMISDDQGCKLEVRIAQPNASAVLIVGYGFPAKAKIPLVLESSGAVANEVLETNADGRAVIAVIPYAPGKSDGTLKASAEGPNCLPSVVLPWSAAVPEAPKTPAR